MKLKLRIYFQSFQRRSDDSRDSQKFVHEWHKQNDLLLESSYECWFEHLVAYPPKVSVGIGERLTVKAKSNSGNDVGCVLC
jgi:hypothetical protein